MTTTQGVPSQPSEAGARKRILVVDDEPQNVDIIRSILKTSFQVLAATDGAKALAIAQSAQPPELILLDIMMPGMDGYETLRRLRADARSRSIPVVFMTARGEIDDKRKGSELGGADYVTKPLDPAFVLSVVRRLLHA